MSPFLWNARFFLPPVCLGVIVALLLVCGGNEYCPKQHLGKLLSLWRELLVNIWAEFTNNKPHKILWKTLLPQLLAERNFSNLSEERREMCMLSPRNMNDFDAGAGIWRRFKDVKLTHVKMAGRRCHVSPTWDSVLCDGDGAGPALLYWQQRS